MRDEPKSIAALAQGHEAVQPVVAAALEWWCERPINDWAEADLARAVIRHEGDWPGCPECDFQCGEPCVPATVAEQLAAVDARIAQLVHEGKLFAPEGYKPPTGWTPARQRKSRQPAALPAQPEQRAVDGWTAEEIEEVIVCLGDEAAKLRDENEGDEMAVNMDRAASMIQVFSDRAAVPRVPEAATPSQSERDAATAALVELVAVKDLKERAAAMDAQRPWPIEVLAVWKDYERRKPLAWAAARAVTQGSSEPDEKSNAHQAESVLVASAQGDRWIPVSEPAPLYVDILVLDDKGSVSVGMHLGHNEYSHHRYPVLGQCRATHWMPLPSAPTQPAATSSSKTS
jgi:hypothetical protein